MILTKHELGCEGFSFQGAAPEAQRKQLADAAHDVPDAQGPAEHPAPWSGRGGHSRGGDQDGDRASVMFQDAGKNGLARARQSLLIYQDETYPAAFGLDGRMDQRLGEIARPYSIVPVLSKLGAEQGPMPLVGHDQEHSGREVFRGTRLHIRQSNQQPGPCQSSGLTGNLW